MQLPMHNENTASASPFSPTQPIYDDTTSNFLSKDVKLQLFWILDYTVCEWCSLLSWFLGWWIHERMKWDEMW